MLLREELIQGEFFDFLADFGHELRSCDAVCPAVVEAEAQADPFAGIFS